ncbi:MAG TPA: hypothetical protein EYP85_11700 [Armatimonadetes bacterium]|nr:hypothetical protein [Armatimonadota bacterium]
MKVIINPGHSTTDPGVMGPTGLYEHDAVTTVAQVLQEALHERRIESEILVQPGGNPQWALNHLMEQVNARQSEVDIFISLHCAADKQREAYGTRVLYLEDSEESKLLAENIQKHFPRTLWSGVQPSQEYILQQARFPAVVIEIDHITNPEVEMLMSLPAWQEKVADNIVNGIFDFIGPQDIRLFIDGQEIYSDPVPQLVYGDVMVPVRLLAEALGATVEWDSERRILSIYTHRTSEEEEPSETPALSEASQA